jgi:hypothetical protein
MAHLSESFSTLKTAGLVEPLVHQTSAKSAWRSKFGHHRFR